MKKLLSLMLVLAMLLSLVPSFAEDGDAALQDNPEAAAELTAEPEEEPAGEEPAGEEPAGEEPVGEEPVGEEPVGEESAGEESAGEEPAGEEPAGEEPAGEEPAGEEPAGEEPAGEEPAGEEPAEEKQEDEKAAPENAEEEDGLEANSTPSVGTVTGLTVTDAQATQLKLIWDEPTPKPDGYEVCWGTTNNYAECKNKNCKTTKNLYYTISGLTCGQEYFFFVTAYSENPETHDPAYFGAHASTKYTLSPSAPASLSIELKKNSATAAVLDWGTKVDEASGYIVYEVVNGSEVQIAKIANNETTKYTHNGLTPKDELVYRVYSYKKVNSKEVKSHTPVEATFAYKDNIPVPNGLETTSISISSIKLTWKTVEGATSYVLERNDGNEFKPLTEVTTNTYTDENLIFGKEYSYVIKAKVGDNYESGWSTSVVGSPCGKAPTGLSVTNISDTKNTATWQEADGANGYMILRNSKKDGTGDSASGWNDLANNRKYEGPNLEFVDTGLTMGKTYFYRLAAYVEVKDASGNTAKIYTPLSEVVSCVVKPGIPKIKVANKTYKEQEITWNSQGSGVKYQVCQSTSSSFSSSTTKKTSSLSYSFSDLKNGTKYYYKVRAYVEDSSGTVYGDWSSVKSMTCAPAAPANVTGTLQNRNQVKVKWDAVDGATSFIIYAKENDGDWKQIATKKASANATTYTYTAKSLNVGSNYVFAVSAVREADGKTATGEKGITDPPIPIDLAAYIPENLKCKVVSTTSVTLSWDEMDGVDTFHISGSSDDDTEYSLSKTVTGNSYTVTGLRKGYTYKFKVRAKKTINGNPEFSSYCPEITATPTSLAPTGLTLQSYTKGYGVTATWKAAADADGYELYKSDTEDGPWTPVTDIGDGAAEKYIDKDYDKTNIGDIVYYRIRSYTDVLGKKHYGPYSAKVKVQIRIPKAVVTAEVAGTKKIKLTWTDVGADEYQVYYSLKSDSGFKLAKTVSGTSFTKDELTTGTKYYFKIRGVKKVNSTTKLYGAYSAVVSATPTFGAPSIISLSPDGGSMYVKWSAISGAKQYQVYYHADGQDWKLGGTVDASKTGFRVNNLAPKTKYTFRVRATKTISGKTVAGKYSATQSEVTKMCQTVNLKSSPLGGTSLQLSWDAARDATSYEVWIADYDPNSNSIDSSTWVKKTTVTTNKAKITGLKANTSYGFKVRAVITRNSITDNGDYCTEVAGYTAPAAPTGLKTTSVGKTSIAVIWNTVSGADGYTIHWRVKGGGWTSAKLEGDIDTYTITGLTKGAEYEIAVRAFANETSSRRLDGPYCTKIIVTTKK